MTWHQIAVKAIDIIAFSVAGFLAIPGIGFGIAWLIGSAMRVASDIPPTGGNDPMQPLMMLYGMAIGPLLAIVGTVGGLVYGVNR